jgi:hypothetical protein
MSNCRIALESGFLAETIFLILVNASFLETITGVAAGDPASEDGSARLTPDDPAQNQRSRNAALPDDPKILEAFELINKSTDLYGWDEPNPVALVRAVNHLHGMGKDQAVETLRAYVRYAPELGKLGARHSPDQQRLCWIIPLLFVPVDESAKFPSLGHNPQEWSREGWKNLCISTEGDVPFHNLYVTGRIGKPDPGRGYLVEWANQHARLIDEPLRPSDDPLQAADELCDELLREPKALHRSREGLKMHIRMQARRTIEHLFPPEDTKNWDRLQLLDRDWQSLKDAAIKLKIRWDEKKQNYVVG